MPFCPVCRLEYRPGFAACADCGAALVEELPPAQARAPIHGAAATDVVVLRAHGQAMAQMWAELLGNHGIAARMMPITGIVDNVYPTDTLYEVLVAAIDAPRALDILPPQPASDRAASPDSDEQLMDEVDRALASGNVDLAEDLLSSLEDAE